MTEIRPITESEAVRFLRLLCDVFSLDFSAARSVFFSEPFFDLNRKWALFRDGEIASILTVVPMTFGWGSAIGIAGVATRAESRGQGLAGQLLEAVLAHAQQNGEGVAMLLAENPALYERCGFQVMDSVVRVPLGGAGLDGNPMSFQEVQPLYDAWAAQNPHRLLRSELRWKYWTWNLRVSWKAGDGYVCCEGNTVREAITSLPPEEWPILPGSSFVGLRSMAQRLGVASAEEHRSSWLMTRGLSEPPQFFLTDQF